MGRWVERRPGGSQPRAGLGGFGVFHVARWFKAPRQKDTGRSAWFEVGLGALGL